MKLSTFEVRKRILTKMARHNYWGGKHTAFDNIPKGFPKELWKEVRQSWSNLFERGW